LSFSLRRTGKNIFVTSGDKKCVGNKGGNMRGSEFTPDTVEENEVKPKYEVKALAEHSTSGPKGLVVNGQEVPFVAAPKLEELPIPQVQKYPVITESERFAVRDAQFVRTQTREQAQVAVQNADQKLSATINALAQKYHIDPKVSDFNMVTLTFVDKVTK